MKKNYSKIYATFLILASLTPFSAGAIDPGLATGGHGRYSDVVACVGGRHRQPGHLHGGFGSAAAWDAGILAAAGVLQRADCADDHARCRTGGDSLHAGWVDSDGVVTSALG